ncbi:MAG: hypothetical protein ACRC10_10980 [Thermoguttaceae bacterium]
MSDQEINESGQEEQPQHKNGKNALFGKNQESQENGFESFLKTVSIPQTTDPVLLRLWIERERKKFERKTRPESKKDRPKTLALTCTVFLTLLVMILSILLGLSERKTPDLILSQTCSLMCVFACLGYVFGRILENCVVESSRELLREVIQRSTSNDVHEPNVPTS